MTEEEYNEMWKIFKNLGSDAIFMNHYDLANTTQVENPMLWKSFLMDTEVDEYIKSEVYVLQETELKKMLQNIGTSKSVGKAQLINVLTRLKDDSTTKTGPIFIYTYVPLSKEQEQAENIKKLSSDPFLD